MDSASDTHSEPATQGSYGLGQDIDTGEQVLPFYIVCDKSASMASNGGIDAINSSLPDLHAPIAADPLVNDKSRIALIAFSDEAHLLCSLAPASDIDEMPGVAPDGATRYGKAFELLRSQIEMDIQMLKADGFRVFRPAVFFISDGAPTDDGWRSSHSALTDRSQNPQAPNIIAFGVDQADPGVVQEVATAAAFLADTQISPANALKEIIRSLTNSIVASSSSSSPTLVIPPAPDGTISLPLDPMD